MASNPPTLEEQFQAIRAQFQVLQNESIASLSTAFSGSAYDTLMAELTASSVNSIPDGDFRRIISDFKTNLASIKNYVNVLAEPLETPQEGP